MIRRFAIIVLFAFPFLTGESFAQDPEFSQFYANPLYLNPALAGVTICARANANYRNQWPAIGHQPAIAHTKTPTPRIGTIRNNRLQNRPTGISSQPG